MKPNIDQLCINTLRFLAVDAVESAKSGHPGLPLGAAPTAYLLWHRYLRCNPSNPRWFNRDRFVLSAGHGSMLLYGLLHLAGYDLSLDEIKNFRQMGSKTPGHPEYDLASGVECTTGPLGQGFAMGIGMAMAEKYLASYFNRPGFPVVDHYTYIIISDGDLMEGISSEAASLAGHLRLGKVVALYDCNRVSIDGPTDLAFTEDVGRRFDAYGWQVEHVCDGNDLESIARAIEKARNTADRPSLVIIQTHIGYGSPKQDSASAHGEPLGSDAARKTKENLGWPLEPLFYVPEEVKAHFRMIEKGKNLEAQWNSLLENYREAYPELASRFREMIAGKLPKGWDEELPVFPSESPVATRNASGKVLNILAKRLENLVGGSADLSPSNKTIISDKPKFGLDGRWGPNIHYGVREHAMGAITNGMALHGGIIPYAGTFLIFSDYMRPAIRLSALMRAHSIFIFTHDSIALGEDGPTHQPVEHLISLRAIPNFTVIRPADANETAVAWKIAIQHPGPVALLLTRQDVPVLDHKKFPIFTGVPKGAYILSESDLQNRSESEKPEIILIASGSEVHLALSAQKELSAKGIFCRVVSMPCWEIFDQQPEEYRRSVLIPKVPKLAIEAGSPLGWEKYVGEGGGVVGINRFGASAPGKVVYEKLGFHVSHVVEKAMYFLPQRCEEN